MKVLKNFDDKSIFQINSAILFLKLIACKLMPNEIDVQLLNKEIDVQIENKEIDVQIENKKLMSKK